MLPWLTVEPVTKTFWIVKPSTPNSPPTIRPAPSNLIPSITTLLPSITKSPVKIASSFLSSVTGEIPALGP